MKRLIQIMTVAALLVPTIGSAQNFCQVEITPFPDTITCGDTVTLQAQGSGGQVQLGENFNLAALGPGWQATPGIFFNNPCGPGPTGAPNDFYMWMGNGIAANRAVTTVNYDLSCGGVICFDFRMEEQGGGPICEGPDEPNEGVRLQYSTNNGATWNNIYYFNPDTICCGCPPGGCAGEAPSPFIDWDNYCFNIPPAAQTTATQIRWFQVNTSGANFDHWGLDNVTIATNCGTPYSYTWSQLDSSVTPPVTNFLFNDPSATSVRDTFLYTTTDFTVEYFNSTDTCYDTTRVTVLPRPITLTVSDSQICDFETVSLQATGGSTYAYSVLPGGDPIQIGTNFSCANCDNPDVTPATTTSYVVASEFTGLCHAYDTVEITVVPPPDPTITTDPLHFCREEGPYQLTAATPGGTWVGIGMDATTGIFDPLAVGSAGNSTVIYTFTQPCVISDTVTVQNHRPYEANFVDTPQTTCVNDTLVLTNFVPVTGAAYGPGPVRYRWFGPGITDPDQGFFDPATLGAGNFTVTLTASDTFGNCPSSKTMRIQVYAIDTPNVTQPLSYCNTSVNALVAIDRGFGPNSNWDVNPIPPTTSTVAVSGNGTFNPRVSGPGSWLLDYSFTNLNGCTGELTDTIRVLETPPRPLLDTSNFCAGEAVILRTGNATDPDSVFWYETPNADPSSELGNGSPFFYGVAQDPNNTGPITLYARQLNGICPSGISPIVLPIVPDPDGDFVRFFTDSNGIARSNVPRDQVIVGPSALGIEFQALNVLPGDSLFWNLWVDCELTANNDRFGCPLIDDNNRPRVALTYEKEGAYRVLLVHTNSFGCVDSVYAEHEVLFQAEIPNVFTPNGDGENDAFIIPGAQGLRDFNCKIYNRWGRLIHEWNDPSQGWDGTGANDGVYFFIVTGKRAGGEDYIEQGEITLLGSN